MKRFLVVMVVVAVAGPLAGVVRAGEDEWADFGKVAAGILGYQIINELWESRPAADPGWHSWGTWRSAPCPPYGPRYRYEYERIYREARPPAGWRHRHEPCPPAYSTGHWEVYEYRCGEYRSRWVPESGYSYSYRSYGW